MQGTMQRDTVASPLLLTFFTKSTDGRRVVVCAGRMYITAGSGKLKELTKKFSWTWLLFHEQVVQNRGCLVTICCLDSPSV